MRDRSVIAKIALLFAALIAIAYWPVFLGRVPLSTDDITQFPPFRAYYYSMSVRTPHAELGDAITEIYPWRKFASEAIRRGVIPLWNPHLLAGMPFQANPLSALFHPLNFIFIFLPMPMAWSLSLMLKVFLAATFTFLFVREIGASVSGAIVAATAFAFGGFMTGWLAWPRVDTSLWLPLLCFQIHRLCRQPSRRNAIVLAALSTMPILAGHPGMVARVLVTVAGYGVWTVLWQHSRSSRQRLAWLSVAGCLAVGLAAVQLAPSIEWLRYIFRTLDMPGFPLPVWQAIGLFSRDMSRQPNSAGVFIPEGAVYVGALSLLAAVYAFFRRDKKDVAFFAIVFVINFCTAYGVSPVAELSQTLPVFKGLRMDEALMLVDFSLAVLAGLGISYLEAFEWKAATKTERAGTVGVLLTSTAALHQGAAVLSMMTQRGVVEWWRSPRSFRVLLIVSAFLIGLQLLQLLSRRAWIVLVSVWIAADLVSFSYGHMPFNRVETIYPDVPLFGFLSQRPKPFRVVSLDSAAPGNVEYVYGLSTAGGYEYMLKRTSSLTESLVQNPGSGFALSFTARKIIESNNRIVDLLNVRYLIATKFNESESLMRSSPNRFREVWSDGNASLFENLTCLPRAFLVPQTNTETIPSEEAQLARLKENSFDPEQRVILPAGLEPSDIKDNIPGPHELVKYSEGMNWVRLQVNAATPSVLVLSQIHYPGWRVYVDGKRAPLLRPDYALMGTIVNGGTHDVEFRFLPMTFFVGAMISLASVLLAAVSYAKAKRVPPVA